MILIADSGSTKTEWCMISKGKVEKYFTSGVNPFYQTTSEIYDNLVADYLGPRKVDTLFFYGAGCINTEKKTVVLDALERVFDSSAYFIGSDLFAAARSLCQHEEGVACILGTGSNSCLYNGKEIVANISPLGYILGDEGSGAVLGKKLIGDVLKKQLPKEILEDFYHEYPTNAAEILENVYKKSFPNRYLATYTRFLSKHVDSPEISKLVLDSFDEFIKRNLLQYPNIHKLKVNFTGSIAYHFSELLEKAIEKNNLMMGQIVKAPMDGLIQYHTK